MNKVTPFLAITASFALTFLSSSFIAFEEKLLRNAKKIISSQRNSKFVSAFLPKLANQESKDPPNWVILSTLSVNILLAKAFFILVTCLVVKKNSCGNSSSWKFFLFILIIIPVLFLLQILIWLVVYLLVSLSLFYNLPLSIILLHFLQNILVSLL